VEIIPAPGWEELFDALKNERGTFLFLGATDAGKSTLIRWLIGRRAAERLVTALVDSDVGQSALCLPGGVGMSIFRDAGDAQECGCAWFSFLGTPNPARVVPGLVATTGRYAQLARDATKLVLIDTTGLVEGELGIGLKLAKLEATGAEMVIAIQRDCECEPILGSLRNVKIYRLSPAPSVKIRNQETRARRRMERLTAYFAAACHELAIYGKTTEFSLFGRLVNWRDIRLEQGAVIGLNRGEATLALGLVTETDGEGMTLRTPLVSLRGINRIVAGDIIL